MTEKINKEDQEQRQKMEWLSLYSPMNLELLRMLRLIDFGSLKVEIRQGQVIKIEEPLKSHLVKPRRKSQWQKEQ